MESVPKNSFFNSILRFPAYSLQRVLSKRPFAKEAGFAPVRALPLFGRTAVRPYKKKMIMNGMTDEEDRPASADWFLSASCAAASLLLLRDPRPHTPDPGS